VERRSLIDTLTRLQGRTIRPIKVLAIDDDEVARYVVKQCLPAPAFDVIEATGGEDGLARARDEHPDVVLLDLMMPVMDGWHVLEQLRNDDATRTTPVVIVTSHTLEPAERDGLQEAFAVVSKHDVSRSTLAPVVQAAAEKDATRQDAAIPPLSP
jgi:CheY-like chemotaxis protein